MSVDQGMDVERVRSIAQQLMGQSVKIDQVTSDGRSQISVLSGAWAGSDLEHFSAGWDGAERSAHGASEALRSFGTRMLAQADDQQRASDGVGGAPGGANGPGGAPGGPGGPAGPAGGQGSGGGLLDTLREVKWWAGMGGKAWALLTKPGVVLAALRYGNLLRAADAAGDLASWMKASWAFNSNAYSLFKGALPGSGILSRLGVPASYLDEIGRSGVLGRITSALPWSKGASLAGNTLGKVFGPLGVLGGAMDLYHGIRDGDYLKAFGGAAGLTSGALTTAIAFGAIAGGPVTLGIAAGAAIVAGGIAIYQNWDAISAGAGKAWEATKDVVGGAVDTVGSVLSDPVGAIGGLF